MHKQMISLGLALLISSAGLLTPADAASFPFLQPYVADSKIGFTDGQKRITQPLYNDFSKIKDVLIVSQNGKMGVLHAKTGAVIIPAVWDNIEIPGSDNLAILRKGGMFQTFIFSTKTYSRLSFRNAHTYYLSDQYESVTVLSGDSTMLVDSGAAVLIPPFKGEVRFVDLLNPPGSKQESTRYPIMITAQGLSMLDPLSLKPLFHVPGVQLRENANPSPYLQVSRNGKLGLLNRNGTFALEPNYTAINVLAGGLVQFRGEKGVGLLKDGEVLAEPIHDDAGFVHGSEDGYFTIKGDTATYCSRKAGTAFSLKRGAQALSGGFILGQDTVTGLYGVKHIQGEAVVPFVYRALEGPPAAWTLVRNDGKKGLLVERDGRVKEPEVWFDSYVTMGSYGLLALKDGNKIGLYSRAKGLLVPLQENTLIRYDDTHGSVLVTTPDGKTREYREYDTPVGSSPSREEKPDISQPQITRLTDTLSMSTVRDQGIALIDTQTGKPLSDERYLNVYPENGLIVAVSQAGADLYTISGERLTTECRLAVDTSGEGPPVFLSRYGDASYALAMNRATNGKALVRVKDNNLTVLSDYVYTAVSFQSSAPNGLLASLVNTDGASELWLLTEKEVAAKLVNIQEFTTIPSLGKVLVKQNEKWAGYDEQLQRVTAHDYQQLAVLSNSIAQSPLIVYQDSRNGLYGLLNHQLVEQTTAKYDLVKPVGDVFPQLAFADKLPGAFVFISNRQFGYLDAAGQEIFRTPLYSKAPKVTHLPVRADNFPEYERLLSTNATELVDFGVPFVLQENGNSEAQFFANLALYFNLPGRNSNQAIIEALVAKGILPANRTSTGFTAEDFFALSYYLINGTTSHQLSNAQLWEWANGKGLYFQRGPHDATSPFADYNLLFINKLLFAKHSSVEPKPKLLTFANLTGEQRKMLETLIQVNGVKYEYLPFPLAKEYVDPELQRLIAEYNRSAAQLLQVYRNNQH